MPVPVRGGNQSYFLRRQSLENKKEFAGAVYHLSLRGNAKQAIFLDEKDFADFLSVLCLVVKRYHFLLHAYCLMNNHDHLNQEQKKAIQPISSLCPFRDKSRITLKGNQGTIVSWSREFYRRDKTLDER